MADVLTKEQRHRNMQHIRGKDTKAEVVLRKTLWARGYRYRKNYSMLPGKPDIVITKERICIFVDSEFFHGKDYLKGYKSNKYNSLKEQLEHSNNSGFWITKIERNMKRDEEVNVALHLLGWEVIRFWSKDVLADVEKCITIIENRRDTRFQ